MESKIAGIDLGTTNSVIAVPGQYPNLGAVFGNVTVIFDDLERLTHASAVCRVEGDLVVGNEALEMACQGYVPVRFVKKYMGSNWKATLGDKQYSPEEISAMVLRHLVTFAQERLGVKIERVVITHPAYFDGLAIQATRRAGELAGLEVVSLIEEPTAAALACARGEGDGGERILVYDLGGGTFDITLLERSGGSFTRLRCGGNRELGGYNIDRKIASKMLGSLRGKNYEFNIDHDHPERDSRWTTLMYHAERLKSELGKGAAKWDIVQNGVFRDDAHPQRSVQLRFSMTQREFRELIEPEISETIRETWRVLSSDKLQIALLKDAAEIARQKASVLEEVQLSKLVLVGGSCRILAIQERLREEFHLEPEIDEDVLDLSVAVGAAAVASTLGTRQGAVTLKAIPSETPELTLSVAGSVSSTPECPTIANLLVTVNGGKQGPVTTLTGPSGAFLLGVPLRAEAENELEISIQTDDGKMLYSQTHTVSQTAAAPLPEVLTQRPMLAQAISVRLRGGFEVLAKEGVILPYKGSQKFRTAIELKEVPVVLFQDNVQLTSVEVSGFSHPIPARSKVEVDVAVDKDYQMTVTVKVPDAHIEKSQVLKLTPLDIPTIEQLRSIFPQKRREFEEEEQNSPQGERKAAIAAEGWRLIDEIEQMLAEPLPEAMRIHLNLKQLEFLTWKFPRTSLTPPKAELLRLLASCRTLLPAALKLQPELQHQELDKSLDCIEGQIPVAERENDAETWAQVHVTLQEMESKLKPKTPPPPPPPASLLKVLVVREIREVRSEAAANQAVSQAQKEQALALLDEGEEMVSQVPIQDEQAAQSRLYSIYDKFVVPARAKLKMAARAEKDVFVLERWGS